MEINQKLYDFIISYQEHIVSNNVTMADAIANIQESLKVVPEFSKISLTNDKIEEILKSNNDNTNKLTKFIDKSTNTKNKKEDKEKANKNFINNISSSIGSLSTSALSELSEQGKTNTDIILGENKEMYIDPLLNIYNKTKNRTKDPLEDISDTLDEMNNISKASYDLQKEQDLENKRTSEQPEKQKKGFLRHFFEVFAISIIGGLSMGALARTIFLPFEFVVNMLYSSLEGLGMKFKKKINLAEIAMEPIHFIQKQLHDWYVNLRLVGFELKNQTIKFIMKLESFKKFVSKSFSFLSNSFNSIGKKLNNIKGFRLLGESITAFGGLFKRFSGFWDFIKTSMNKIHKGFMVFQKKFIGYTRILKIISAVNAGITARITVFLKFFQWGFEYLGKPLQFLISAFVFIKAFIQSKEKTFVGKLNDAVKAVITDFFEMPIRALAWVFEYIAGKFGFDIKGTGDKWVALFDEFTENIFAPFAMFKFLLNRIEDVIDDIRIFGNMIIKIWSKIKGMFKMIKDVFVNGTSKIVKIGSKVIKIVKKIGSFFNKFLKIGKILPDMLGKFLYPITIILSIFDFVTGFMKSESDTFLGKMYDGFKYMIHSFVELPVMIFGWLIEKLLGIFGVEVNGVGDTILKYFDILLDVITSPIRILYKLLTTAVKGWWLIFKTIWGTIWDSIIGVFAFIIDGAKALFKGGVVGLFKHFGDSISGIWNSVKDAWIEFFEVIAGLPKAILNWALNELPGGKIIKKFFAKDEKGNEAGKESSALVKGVFNGLKSFFGIQKDNKSSEINVISATPTTNLGVAARHLDTENAKVQKKTLDQQRSLNDNLTSQTNNSSTQNNGNVTINNIDNSKNDIPFITTEPETLTVHAFNTTYGLS